MHLTWKSLLLQAAIILVALCVGATAMYAWQVRSAKAEDESVTTRGSGMFDVIQDLHNKAHLDNLPVQMIENYN
jgi:hypothetical protein